jgi:small conductance mechanosensitive channel
MPARPGRLRPRLLPAACLALVLALALAWPAGPAAAQAGAGGAALAVQQQDGGESGGDGAARDQDGGAGPSAEELQDLVDTLTDAQRRQEFVDTLQALIEAKRQGAAAEPAPAAPQPEGLGGRLLQGVTERMDAVGDQLSDAVDALERVPGAALELAQGLQRPETRQRWLDIAINLALILGGAVLAERALSLILRGLRGRLAGRANDNLVLRALYLVARTAVEAVPILAFAGAAYGVIAVVQPQYVAQLVAVTLINASVLSRTVALAGRAVLSPTAPGLRLPRLPDRTAVYLYVWLRRVSATAIYGYFATEALLLVDVSLATVAALQKLIGLAVTALAIVFLLQNRLAVARWLRGRDGTEPAALRGVRARLAELWHVLAVIYVAAIYVVWALRIEGGFAFLARATLLTVAIVIAARVVTGALERLLARGFRLSDELKASYPGLEARANRYLPGLRRALRTAVAGLAALMILHVWGAGVLDWLGSEPGRQVLGSGVTVLLLLALAFGVWELISALVERTLTRSTQNDSAKRSARLMTLLPLLRNALRIVLIVVVSLIVLSEVGVDIGPLLAGAGVIGLAIGFGAQTLVKDVITGVFILVEDSLAVGDWVDLGGHGGEVESMTIRTITLRDLHGHVHVVPFSEVTSILNMARDYGFAVIDVQVAYREDTDAVIALLEQVAEELQQDPDWGPKLVGDLEVFGVNNLGDSAVEIRVRIKTRTLAHWGVRREFLRRTKQRFDQEGVEIPYPHRTLYFGADKTGVAPPARVALQRPPRERPEDAAPDAEPEQTSSTTPGEAPEGSV